VLCVCVHAVCVCLCLCLCVCVYILLACMVWMVGKLQGCCGKLARLLRSTVVASQGVVASPGPRGLKCRQHQQEYARIVKSQCTHTQHTQHTHTNNTHTHTHTHTHTPHTSTGVRAYCQVAAIRKVKQAHVARNTAAATRRGRLRASVANSGP
jgi:hypothetical protein